ncbi:MAG: tRNA pseudouridine(55) synthase TruB [Paracoccaceae bacterium]|nr:tRNA pseudouridine(55) synthase TruB [Paracoccaceae bacterium]
MGRRRKSGRDISGWVILDKPAGVTSTSAVGKVRWAFDARKAGHAGTLDPAATGVLAIALGEATKTVATITDALKCYRFTVRFGQATDTDDADGALIAESDARPATSDIESALGAFRGDILQVPPQYSAVRVGGARAYDMAREGETVELDARPLHVARLDLVERSDPDHATLEMVCGKGGYVRSIARDLGAALGCHAHVRDLRRLWSGPFDLADAISLETVTDAARTPELDGRLLPLEAGLSHLPEVRVNEVAAGRLRNGNPAEVPASGLDWGDLAWASSDGRAVAIGRYKGGALHPSRVFAA